MFLKARVVPTCPVSSCDIRSTSAQMPGWRSVILLAVLFCIQCAASHENRHTYRDIKGLPRHLDRLAGWFARPKKLTEVLPLLPRSRPVQPWSFKNLSTARFYSVAVTDTHAVEATVSHAPLPGVSSQMMQWWFEEGIYGKSSYPNDTTGAVWDNYIRWHPQQHMYQRILAEPTNPGPTQPAVDAAQETSLQQDPQLPQPPLLWEICEYLTSSHPTGYTASNYPGAEATAHEYFVKAEAEVKQLDDQGLWVTVPSKTRLGDTFWNLKHSWVDTPEGLVVNSTQVMPGGGREPTVVYTNIQGMRLFAQLAHIFVLAAA